MYSADLLKGYAPGSWSQVLLPARMIGQVMDSDRNQVAADRTSPNGRILGIDIIPAQPPKGVSTIQGNFLSQAVRDEVKQFLLDPNRGRPKQQRFLTVPDGHEYATEEDLETTDYLQLERSADLSTGHDGIETSMKHMSKKQVGIAERRMVDVVLSDMCEPWEQTEGFWKRSLSDPYFRMMNTSGMSFRDHTGSMVYFIHVIMLMAL